MRRVLVTALSLVALGAGGAQVASATGQPNVDCGDPGGVLTPGFQTSGFANAEAHYAGSDGTPSQLHANSPNAVSQYDVACFRGGGH